MPEKIELNKFTVEENGRKCEVIIPVSDDKSYDAYLEEAQRIKTSEQLKNKPPREKPRYSKEHISGALGEFNKWKRETENGFKRRYF